MIYDLTSIEKLYTIGDIHGEYDELVSQLFPLMSVNFEKEVDELEQQLIKELEEEEREEVRLAIDLPDDDLMPREIDFGFQGLHLGDSIAKKGFRRKKDEEKPYDNAVFIVCGDIGLGFEKEGYYLEAFEKINKTLAKVNSHLFFIRGNHDDASYFNDERINFSNIKAISDYSVIKTKKFTTLCVGGAISVDRSWRIQEDNRKNRFIKNEAKWKKTFWENEKPYFSKAKLDKLKEDGIEIDSIATHTAPNFSNSMIRKDSATGWLRVDKHLKTDLDAERQVMTMLLNYFGGEKLKFWSFGHFHMNYTFEENDIVFIANGIMRIQTPNDVIDSYEAKKRSLKMKVKPLKFSDARFVTASATTDIPNYNIRFEPFNFGDLEARTEPINEGENTQENNTPIVDDMLERLFDDDHDAATERVETAVANLAADVEDGIDLPNWGLANIGWGDAQQAAIYEPQFNERDNAPYGEAVERLVAEINRHAVEIRHDENRVLNNHNANGNYGGVVAPF